MDLCGKEKLGHSHYKQAATKRTAYSLSKQMAAHPKASLLMKIPPLILSQKQRMSILKRHKAAFQADITQILLNLKQWKKLRLCCNSVDWINTHLTTENQAR